MIQKFDVDEKISPTILINDIIMDIQFPDGYANWRKDYITKNKPLISKYRSDWDEWYET